MKRKKILKITLIVVAILFFGYYFLANTLVNLIGVPLAAKHSYEAWQMEGLSAEELMQEETNQDLFTLPFFGEVPLSHPREIDVVKDVNGQEVKMDLNFEGDSVEKERLQALKALLLRLDEKEVETKNELIKNFNEGGTVKEYITFHLSELDSQVLKEHLKTTNPVNEETLLSALYLYRIGFYVDSNDSFAVFDYTIGKDIVDGLVVVRLNTKGDIVEILQES